MHRMIALVAALCLLPLSLALAQTGKLDLTNVRPTFGVLGAPRPDSKILPGDVFWLAFDMDGVKVDPNGKVVYGMGLEVKDSAGKTIFKEDENKDQPLVTENSLGGTKLPVFARVDTGTDFPPGEYTLKVAVSDRTGKTSATLERKFQVEKLGFGLVRLSTSYDQEGRMPAPMVGVPGQFLHVNFVAVGFARDKTKKQPHMEVELRILDDKGKPVLDKPGTGVVNKDVAENARGFPMGFVVALNRPGKFSVELNAVDKIAGAKAAPVKFPLTVLPNTDK